ncbi:MAG: flagellar hook-basal body complex protein FliE [SAR324 cluster bacterium]|nr:flagellar hook-basal body complex protein FliE [SAR324 cluster bacterium]
MTVRFNNNVAPNLTLQRQLQETAKTEAKTGNIASTFEKILSETNRLQKESEAKKVEFLTTDKKDLHGTLIAGEKADVSLRLLLKVRNKLTSAYEEIIRMQV